MLDQIEIYVRNSGERTMLNFYVPENLRERFIVALKAGSFSDDRISMALEVTTLSQWITDDDQRAKSGTHTETAHVRIPIDAINLQFTD